MAKVISNPALYPTTTLYPSETLFPKDASYFENSQILHLFEFEFKSLDGLETEILYFTDNDLFVIIDETTYTPISISFDEVKEDFTLQADKVNITLDNLGHEITSQVLTKEWRNNVGNIYRIVYNELPQPTQQELDDALFPTTTLFPSETLFPKELQNGYETGIFSFDDGYPSINFDQEGYLNRFNKDLLFVGLQDSFTIGGGALSGELTSILSVWDTPYPAQTFDQGQHKNIIGAMTTKLDWGS